MRYLLFLPLFVVMLSACSKSDKEQIKGEWTMSEMSREGKVVMSVDPAKQKTVLDEAWKEQGPMMEQMGMTREVFDTNMKTQFKKMGESVFVFTDKGKVEIKAEGQKNSDSNYKMDEEKKKITITEQGKNQVYTYAFDGDSFSLTQNKDKITFKRKA